MESIDNKSTTEIDQPKQCPECFDRVVIDYLTCDYMGDTAYYAHRFCNLCSWGRFFTAYGMKLFNFFRILRDLPNER